MSMSTEIIGFIPPDEKWKKMKAIWDSCEVAGVDPPAEVEEFFEDGPPDPNGQEKDIPMKEWNNDDMNANGFEIEVAKIPKNVKIIRFYNSW